MSIALKQKAAATVSRQPRVSSRAATAGDGPVRAEEMVNLYRSILGALPDASCRIIEILSASRGEGVSTVVRALAQAAATIANARVLVCDATPELDDYQHFGMSPHGSLNEVVNSPAELRQVIEPVPGRGYALCAVSDPGAGANVAVNLDVLDPVLAELRKQFDLVIVDAPSINRGILGPALAKKVDGVVMVVQAEHTRAPVVTEAQRIIEVNGGRLLGVVLNRRRFHIPRWIYRWL
jgi:Mrp family chromosome partitioning ATPase